MVHARSGKGRLFLLEKNAHLYTREDWEDDVTEEYDDVDDVEIEQADQPMKPSGVSEALTANEDYGHVVYGIDDMASELNRTLATDNMWQKLRLNHVPFRDYFCDLSTSSKWIGLVLYLCSANKSAPFLIQPIKQSTTSVWS